MASSNPAGETDPLAVLDPLSTVGATRSSDLHALFAVAPEPTQDSPSFAGVDGAEGLLSAVAADVGWGGSAEPASEARELEERRIIRMFQRAERLAKLGTFELDLGSRTFVLSNEARRIYEVEDGVAPTFAHIRSRMAPEFRRRASTLFKRCLKTGQAFELTGEIQTSTGRHHIDLIADAERRDNKVVRVFGTSRDITAEREREEHLWRAAHHDALTGAPNRHYWMTRLDHALVRAAAEHGGLTILMFDLDGFKEINDTRGHAVGDAVLSELAKRLAETLPDGAFHARLGGDEFAVLFEGFLPAANIEVIVYALLAAIQKPILVDALCLQISGTFGAASFPDDARTASDLMQKADIALYQAKRSRRGAFVSFRSEIGDLFNDKRYALDLIAAAIQQDRLVPFYQPKIDLETGRTIGFEALCRIEAADGTILGPSHFLPALQDPSTCARIGAAMLELVTADIAAWSREGLTPGRVSINLTCADFAKGDLDLRVIERVGALALPPGSFEIEISENTILGKEAQIVGEALRAMHDQGIVIALDDFGTGYASLTNLRDAPIRYLKLDRAFIAGLGRGTESAIIVRSIVDLGHSMGMRIVAEGIETKGQAEFLRAIGCDEAQGFLYGRPSSRKTTRAALEDARRTEAARQASPTTKGYFNLLSKSA
jgi:diguanylate cyclase (GGDEF)-like protein